MWQTLSKELRFLIVTLFSISLVLLLALPTFQTSGIPATRGAQCKFSLRTIGNALDQYHAFYGGFPDTVSVGNDPQRTDDWVACLRRFSELNAMGLEFSCEHCDSVGRYIRLRLDTPVRTAEFDRSHFVLIEATEELAGGVNELTVKEVLHRLEGERTAHLLGIHDKSIHVLVARATSENVSSPVEFQVETIEYSKAMDAIRSLFSESKK